MGRDAYDIVMLVLNNVAYDTRVRREAAALAAGADAFISKSEPTERFLEMVFGAIRRER